MKILLLTHSLGWPIHDGYALRVHHLSRLLAQRHELHLLTLGRVDDAPELRAPFRSITVLGPAPRPVRPAWQRVVRAFDADQPHGFDPRVLAALELRLAAEAGFDALWVCGSRMLGYSRRLPARVRIFADLSDDEVLACRNRFLSAPLTRRPRVLLDWIRVRRFLAAGLRNVGIASVVAEPDRDSLLRRHPELDVRVVRNGVDAAHFAPEAPLAPQSVPATRGAPLAARGRDDEPLLVFEGNMGFAPNAEGAVHFCTRILPLLRAELPRVRVALVGRDPTPQVRALAGPGLEVTGRVEDVRPYLRRATLFVCPLLSGAGIKNKILQAWALGLPVVATSISGGGLDVQPERNIVLADGPRAFADAVLRLLRDPALRAGLGAAGRAHVLAQHGWESSARELEALLLLAAGAAAAPAPAARTPAAPAGYRGQDAPASLASHHP